MNARLSVLLILFVFTATAADLHAQKPVPSKPRIIVSTDIGGTDPDDNQSMAHLLMYSDRVSIEGLVSSPSYGEGNAGEILRMIDLYEKDLPKMKKHAPDLTDPDYLRSVVKQGRRGGAPWAGYTEATEGSEWIVRCAEKESDRPLWVLVWGGLEDLAQALHDAPGIQDRIRVYWIGGPNKKWSANSYAYIAANFLALHFIEVNSSYYGFFSKTDAPDTIAPSNYYEKHIEGAGELGRDFKNYYRGEVKMGDTPSLLYVMDGDPADPTRESWGGSYERFDHSPRVVFDRVTGVTDTVAFCTVVELVFRGPEIDIPADSVCFWMDTPYGKSVQSWAGFYLGGGRYGVRYAPKQAETVRYSFRSQVPGFSIPDGVFVVDNFWPGKRRPTDYPLGPDWYTDKADPELYDGRIQGGKTVSKWRHDALSDWARRWEWLK